jgi:class 3 adenylate cyclase
MTAMQSKSFLVLRFISMITPAAPVGYAYDMQKKLKDLRIKLKEEGKPELLMRVGLNTGSILIENMGSNTSLDVWNEWGLC